MKALRRISKRIVAVLLMVSMVVSLLPNNLVAYADEKTAQFDEAFIEELASISGSREEAITILNTLYDNGYIDDSGNPIKGETFNVNGTTVSRDDFIKMAKEKDSSVAVTIDGIETTWGEMSQLIYLNELLEAIQYLKNDDTVLTQEHKNTMQSFSDYFNSGKMMQTLMTDKNFSLFGAGEAITVEKLFLTQSGDTANDDGTYSYVVDQANTSSDVINKYAIPTNIKYNFLPTDIKKGTGASNAEVNYIPFYAYSNSGALNFAQMPTLTVSSFLGTESENSGRPFGFYIDILLNKKSDKDITLNYKILDGAVKTVKIDSTRTNSTDYKQNFYPGKAEVSTDKTGKITIAAGKTQVRVYLDLGYYSFDEYTNFLNTFGGQRYFAIDFHNIVGATPMSGGTNSKPMPKLTQSYWIDGRAKETTGFLYPFKNIDHVFKSPDDPDKIDNKRSGTCLYYYIPLDADFTGLESVDLRAGIQYFGFSDNSTTINNAIVNGKFQATLYISSTGPKGADGKVNEIISNTLSCGTPPGPNDIIIQKIGNIDSVSMPKTKFSYDYFYYFNNSDANSDGTNSRTNGLGTKDSTIITNGKYPTINGPISKFQGKYLVFELYTTYSSTISSYYEHPFKLTEPEWWGNNTVPRGVTLYARYEMPSAPLKPTFSIPDGDFYAGQQVPITVNLGTYAKITRSNPKITVNGVDLSPAIYQYSITGTDNVVTYLYTVKDNDALTLNVTDFSATGLKDPKDVELQFNKTADFTPYNNVKCKLHTPMKVDSFDISQATFEKSGNTYTFRVPFKDGADLISWAAAEAEPVDGNTRWRMKSIYASLDGDLTRIPVYMEVNDNESFSYTSPITGETITYNEKPVAIYLTFDAPSNLDSAFKLDSMLMYLDPDLSSPIDYIESPDKKAPLILDNNWRRLIFTPPSVFFDEADVSLDYDYTGTWKELCNKDTNKIEGIYAESLLQLDEIKLSYLIGDRKNDFSFVGPDNFEWRSSDESILKVEAGVPVDYIYNGSNVKKLPVTVIPTGKAGTAHVILVVKNGGEEFEINSEDISLLAGLNPYLAIPKNSQRVLALSDDPAKIYFMTNLFERNKEESAQQETTYTLKLYETDEVGNKSSDSIKTFTVTSTEGNIASSVTIPDGVLNTVSSKGGYSYLAEISATHTETGRLITAQPVLITVISAPIKTTLTIPKSYFVTTEEDYDVSWNFKSVNNASSDKKWFYTVTRMSDNKVVMNEESTDFTKDMSFTIPFLTDKDNSDFKIEGLKEIYAISISGSNDPLEDGYSMDSYLLYVYNHDALDIAVYDALSKSTQVVDGVITMGNEDWIKDIPRNADGKSLKLKDDEDENNKSQLTIDQLRQDVNLSVIVSIKYGDYAWGLLSDQIGWESRSNITGELSNDVRLTYYKGGIYSDIRASAVPTFLPTSDFMLVGTNNDEFTIKATHARSGMSTDISGTSKSLKDKLYLFQFMPKTEVTLTYKTDTETVTLKTDKNGAIAIYEPNGIRSDIICSADMGESGMYTTTVFISTVRTSEADIASLQMYPLNMVTMQKASEANIYLVTPDGKPYANKNVIVRGGAYYMGLYSRANLYKTEKHDPRVDNSKSNGIEPIGFTTDNNGLLKVYFDVSEVAGLAGSGDGYLYDPSYPIKYAFELQFENDEYRPEIFEMNLSASTKKEKVGTELINLVEGGVVAPFIRNTDFRIYEKFGSGYRYRESFDVAKLETDLIGPSEKFSKTELAASMILWGKGVGRDENGLAILPDVSQGGDAYEGYYMDAETQIPFPGQESEYFVYPFSTMPVMKIVCEFSTETFEIESKEGLWKGPWLATGDKKLVDLNATVNGTPLATTRPDYKIFNGIGLKEAVKSEPMKEASVEAAETVEKSVNIDKLLDNIVPEGDMLADAMSFFGSLAGSDNKVQVILLPTADPTFFKVILAIGDYPEVPGLPGGDEGDDGVSMKYSEDVDYDKIAEQFGEAGEADDGDDEDEDGGPVEFKLFGSMICDAQYDIDTQEWQIYIVGGEVGGKVSIEKEYNLNFWCGPIPVTMSFKAYAGLLVAMGAQVQTVNESKNASVFTTLGFSAGVEAFAGIGFDISIIALKIGIFGNLGFTATQKLMVSSSPVIGAKQGQHLQIKGEIGLKFMLKILCFTYERIFASVKFGWEKSFGDYDKIVAQWSGTTAKGMKYSAMMDTNGETQLELMSSGIESRDYLDMQKRVWTASLFSGPTPTNWFENIQTNSYPFANPLFNDDGSIITFLSDSNSVDIEKTVASWAKWDDESNGYKDMGPIARKEGDKKEDYGYGDSYLKVAGANNEYFATWVQETDTVIREKNKYEVQDGTVVAVPNDGEITMEDLSMALNSTEIAVAHYTGDEWVWERLTTNNSPDMAPSIASSGNKAIVAWRSTYSSSDNPLDFNVDDSIYYSIFDGTNWSQSQVAYNGTSGRVQALEVKMADNGSAVIAYTIKTGEDLASRDLETCYTYIPLVGASSTIKVTNDTNVDENVQIALINKQDRSQQFVIGWYSESYDESGTNHDIRLVAVNDNGTIDTSFIESINSNLGSETSISHDFRFAIANEGTINDLKIAWTQRNSETSSSTLMALGFYTYNGMFGTTSEQVVTEMPQYNTIDHYDVYSEGNKINAVLLSTDYSEGNSKLVDEIDVTDLVNQAVIRSDFDNDADYQAAWDAMYLSMSKEHTDGMIKIMEAAGTTNIQSSSYTFEEKIELVDVLHDKHSIIPSMDLNVNYVLRNGGITPITKLDVTDNYNGEISVDLSNNPILPGSSQTITLTYTLGDSIKNVEYAINATAIGGNAGEISGFLEINKPDVGIMDIEIASQENGERPINVRLYNDSYIPLLDSGKTVELGFYADSNYEIPIGDKVEISGDDLGRIDNGAYNYQENIDVSELLTTLYDSEQKEIPNAGVDVYVKTEIKNDETTQSENNKRNNKSTITINSPLKRADGKSVSIMGTSLSEDEDKTIIVNVTAKNNSLQNSVIENILVELYNDKGELIGEIESYDETEESFVTLNKEESKTISLRSTLTASDETVVASYKAFLVLPKVKAKAPVIDTQPEGISAVEGVSRSLTVDASATDDGTLSYQWYSNTSALTTGGTLISGADSNSYDLPTDTIGTYYYYVVVTNTIADNGDGGEKTAETTSDVVTVTITEAPPLDGTASITGENAIGQQVTAITNEITVGEGDFTYEWMADNDTVGSNASTYTISPADVGKTISCVLTRVGTKGSMTLTLNGGVVPYNIVITNIDDDVAEGDTAVTISSLTGREDDVITINYTLGNLSGKSKNIITFSNASGLVTVKEAGESTSQTYTVNKSDATNGEITIAATFVHTDLTPQSITFGDGNQNEIRTVGDSEFTKTATLSGDGGTGEITYSSSDTEVATVDSNSGLVTILSAGTTTIMATKASDDIYEKAKASYVLTVKPVATISDVTYSIVNTTYNKMQQSLSVTPNAGVGTVTVKYNGSEIAPTEAGTYAITIDVEDGVSYGKATNIALGNWTIDKAVLMVEADPQSKVRGAKDPQFTYHITSGSLFAGDILTGSLSRIASESEGNYPIVLGTLNNPNYKINFMGNYLTVKSKASDPMPVLSSISGVVTVDNGDPSDVVVTIMQGNKIFGKSIGTNYSFSNLIAGAYNITAKNDSGTKTVYKEIIKGAAITVDMNIGMKSTEIEVKGEDVPPVVMSVSALEDMLEKDPSISSLKLLVETKSVPQEIMNIASGQTLVLNLDFKVIKNNEELSTYEFNQIITGTFPIPEEARGREITIFRLHDGVARTMTVRPNAEGEYVEIGKDTITLHVKKFSDYAVGYKTPTTNSNYEVVNTKIPQITIQPISGSIKAGDTKKLVVEATSSDGGVLSYQWYSNTSALTTGGTLISGATSTSYNVPTGKVGTYYYYVVVTNSNQYSGGKKTAQTISSVVTVTVVDKETKTFKITYNVNKAKNVSKMPSDNTNYINGTIAKVKGTPICTSRFFAGWNTKADGSGTAYEAGKSIKVSKNITLYAQWKDTFKSDTKLVYKVTGKNTATCTGTTDSKATTIAIPNSITYKGITYNVTSITSKAFYGNKTITSIKIGNNVKTIGNHVFYGCTNLEKITIGTGLVTIGNHAFCQLKDGCIITINSTKLKSVKSAINHGVKNMVVKVPKSRLEAYKKLFITLSKTVTVKEK